MKRRTLLLTAACCAALATPGLRAADSDHDAAEQAATESAEAWLKTIDSGDFAKCWEEAAAFVHTAVTKDEWEGSIDAARTPLGEVKSRKLKSKQYTTSLPGAPDGEYVVLQFDTVFENKAKAVETVTPMREKDGSWKVSGYYIR